MKMIKLHMKFQKKKKNGNLKGILKTLLIK